MPCRSSGDTRSQKNSQEETGRFIQSKYASNSTGFRNRVFFEHDHTLADASTRIEPARCSEAITDKPIIMLLSRRPFAFSLLLLRLFKLALACAATPYSFELTGSCSHNFEIDDSYDPVNTTNDGRWFYKGQAHGLYIYFDPDCDGALGSISSADVWLVDSDEPSSTASADLDGDGACLNAGDGFKARIVDSSAEPPTGTQSWRVWCGSDGAVDTDLTIVMIGAPTASPTATLKPTFSVEPTLTVAPTNCYNTDNGATDPYGDGCDDYLYTYWCGSYDGSDFSSETMCCQCGGGSRGGDSLRPPTQIPTVSSPPSITPLPTEATCSDTDNGATDPYGDGCEAYTYTVFCGDLDDGDFSSNMMCCLCGGGSFSSSSTAPTQIPTLSSPPSTTPSPTTMYEVATFTQLSTALSAPCSMTIHVIVMSIVMAAVIFIGCDFDDVYCSQSVGYTWHISGGTVEGGAVLDGGGSTRLFVLTDGNTLTLQHLKLINSYSVTDFTGALTAYGAGTKLIVKSCTMTSNTAVSTR